MSSAVEALLLRILSGQFAEGEALNQVSLAREFAIGRIALREAMRQLEAEGLLVFQPGIGAVASGLSLAVVREVIKLRSKLETELLADAISELSEKDFAQASAILDQFDVALKRLQRRGLGRAQLEVSFNPVCAEWPGARHGNHSNPRQPEPAVRARADFAGEIGAARSIRTSRYLGGLPPQRGSQSLPLAKNTTDRRRVLTDPLEERRMAAAPRPEAK
ncbi:MAG: GntR family transcriptional regulator [Candidatus Acidiferrales bacterium]